ncbi:hypothetical protein BC628DRAFT_1488178 [Trametes gibbosa]|nr:hypothetical protein BC628DRAFT_1488178 [Trametes gibbosa]
MSSTVPICFLHSRCTTTEHLSTRSSPSPPLGIHTFLIALRVLPVRCSVMGPSRKTTPSEPSTSKGATGAPRAPTKKSKRPQHKNHPSPATFAPASSSSALPGVQKIKAALRQTRRLLAKDKLAADVRVATERRLRSLEGDLAAAERARLERTMSARYHKIKFFERQKVVRKLLQAKRKLAAGVEDGADAKEKGMGKKERKELERRVADLRVDLCYILHYPKTKKYISLFPPEVRHAGAGAEASAKDIQDASETDRQREQIRKWMREQMDAGTISWEPEVELEKSERRMGSATNGTGAPTMDAQGKGTTKKADVAKSSTAKAVKSGVADDDFFGADDGEESDASASSGAVSAGGGGSDEDIDMDE